MKYLLTLVLLLAPLASYSRSGHDQGNGGGTVECPRYPHPFSLDYVLTVNEFGSFVKPAKVASLEKSLDRIERLLKKKVPQLATSFSIFRKNLRNETDPQRPYFWKRNTDLSDTEDQDVENLPVFCRTGRGTTVRFYQAIVRHDLSPSPENPRIVFLFDPSVISELDSLQQSFLYVHEWLWSVSSNIRANRKANYLLHSVLMNRLTNNETAYLLREYGLEIK